MIEHPDHTGASANPAAPWNQEEAQPLVCSGCGHEPEEREAIIGDTCLAFNICDGRYETKVDDE